ncbi:hypothetical protein T492DRAFT_884968 [Pavlovales sp. CCMP2436]|nr:hypothetical protein T492DRAFT_884968 [Pavlovales sp. CCMP2436]
MSDDESDDGGEGAKRQRIEGPAEGSENDASSEEQETPEMQMREESGGNFIMVETIDETFSRWSGEEGSLRGQFAAACGVGKTLTQISIAKLAFDLEYVDTVAIFAPNLNLIGQHTEEWDMYMGADKFEKLVVCSEIGDKFGISVTTSADEIFKFLIKRPAPSEPRRLRVIFCTYQSARRLGEAQKKARTDDEEDKVKIGLAHLDEAHRTTGPIGDGPMSMSSVLFDDIVEIMTRLSWTATPRHIKPRIKPRRDGKPVASMDDPELYGDVWKSISFRGAVELGCILPYKARRAHTGPAGPTRATQGHRPQPQPQP